MQNKFNMVDSFEKIEVKIYPTATEGSIFAAQQIASLIRDKASKSEMVALGLATGSSPIKIYAELVRMHKEEGLSFKNVITFNLDEYYPIDKNAYQSYWIFMHRNLFNHIDIDPKNIHLPNGNAPKAEMKNYCASYEQAIEAAGGIDLQILGIGQNGHIGFNEPGASILSKTRLVNLENSTRIANSYEFETITKVPRIAVTIGISIVAKSVEGNITESIPASILQQHNDCTFIIDEAASTELTRIKSPWLTGDCVWTNAMIKRAVVNLALKLNKSVLSLTSLDYTENGLSDLLVEQDDVYEINLQVFYMLRDSITGWPGGKPNAVIPAHPERSEPHPKRCLIFSPHPDDDIISMGGTFMRLHDQGHEVHVAYQTSGNIAVTDEFVTRFIDFAVGFEEMFGMDNSKSIEQLSSAEQFISSKKKDQMDTREIRAVNYAK